MYYYISMLAHLCGFLASKILNRFQNWSDLDIYLKVFLEDSDLFNSKVTLKSNIV